MPHVLGGLAANAALPSELVDQLISIADDDIAMGLACRADLSRVQAVALAERVDGSAVQLAYEGRLTAADVDPSVWPDAALALLDQGAGRPEWARLLAVDPDRERREKLAACRGLPSDVVDTLAADPDVRVVAELALWTTADVAERLAAHPHAEVRRAVAGNEETPPAALAALVTVGTLPEARSCLVCDREETPFVHHPQSPRPDCDLLPGASCDGSHESTVHDMRAAAIRNPATPVEAVSGFVEHPSMLLRWALAARQDLSPQAFARLAADPHPGVRADLAENPAIDDALIRALADDRDLDVRRRLARHPRVPLDVLTRLARTAKIGATLLPRIAAASPSEVVELATSRDPAVRMLVAQRRDLLPEIRDRLADDPDAKVIKALAPHPGLTETRLRAMVDRHGVRVLAGVATNPDATPALLENLVRHQPPVQKVFREVARHRGATASALLACLADTRARRVAAGNPALPPPVIAELLADADWRVAEAAAANPSLPPAVMSALVIQRRAAAAAIRTPATSRPGHATTGGCSEMP
ncbi:hypothetical protein JCM4814A_82480 [Streptomyces phaeofaciens JCM 4814]|uniref:Leucine rich repeat variant n=1 Tax=Streptomyces phaeofaciens TaxID=68254 RepID=A0A918M161_9ACTN|nr:hypothetical protein [Streptomyces phaeofaciens]GGT90210.1 hypothetical protein GCM10010226_80480 [Streptomyces phaeofaciens]